MRHLINVSLAHTPQTVHHGKQNLFLRTYKLLFLFKVADTKYTENKKPYSDTTPNKTLHSVLAKTNGVQVNTRPTIAHYVTSAHAFN